MFLRDSYYLLSFKEKTGLFRDLLGKEEGRAVGGRTQLGTEGPEGEGFAGQSRVCEGGGAGN